MTPLYKINMDGSTVWAKLENQNPTGTHKDRSMKPWIEYYLDRGITEFAISSSGNSAVSAAKFCAENLLRLHVFVSPNIDRAKISALQDNSSVVLHLSKTPRKDSVQHCKKLGITNLRASTDNNALVGYHDIALELTEQLPPIDNIFIPTSSGATLEGMYLGFAERGTDAELNAEQPRKTPAFFVVQTTKVHPIASYFDKDFVSEKTSHATAIVDMVAHRRSRVIEIVKETGGGGLVISNKELEAAKETLEVSKVAGEGEKFNFDEKKLNFEEFARRDSTGFGWHSALAFASFLKWQKQNPQKANKEISVCLFTD